jgi:hypothetical protein
MTHRKKLIEVALPLDLCPEQFILAIVEVENGQGRYPHRGYRFAEPNFEATNVGYNMRELLMFSKEPN